MTRIKIISALAVALALIAVLPIHADDSPGAAYARNLEFVGGRAVQLAEAIPADAYGWRPMEGVRSVSESVMHMAGALKVPTVALFGSTDPALWKPPAKEVVVVKSEGRIDDDRGPEFGWMENIGVDAVWDAWQVLPGNQTPQ